MERLFEKELKQIRSIPTFKTLVKMYIESDYYLTKAGILHALVGKEYRLGTTLMQKVQFLTEVASKVTQIEPYEQLRKLALNLLVSRVFPEIYKGALSLRPDKQNEFWVAMEFLATEPNLPKRVSHTDQNQITALMGVISMSPEAQDHGKFKYETYIRAMINTGTIHAIFSKFPQRDFQNSLGHGYGQQAERKPMFDALPMLLRALRKIDTSPEFESIFDTETKPSLALSIWGQSPESLRKIKDSKLHRSLLANMSNRYNSDFVTINAHCEYIKQQFWSSTTTIKPEYHLADACMRLLGELNHELFN